MAQINPHQCGCPEPDGASTGKAPLVSVVMPTYNRADVLLRAIRSILDQDFADFELLVIDDGSSDETATLIAGLAEPRLRYCRFEVNRGIGAARREGVSRSRGKLVAFLDSDDCWKPGKLTKLVATFTQYPLLDIAFSDFENINSITNTRERGFVTVRSALELLDISPLVEHWWAVDAGAPEALMRQNFLGTCSVVLVGRSVFERAGNFREDLSGPEDLEMWWRAALFGARFAYTTDVLVERYKDSHSITAQTRAFGPRMLKALDACEETARRLGRLELLEHVGRARRRTWCNFAEACAQEGRLLDAWNAFRSGLPDNGPLRALRHVAMAVGRPWITAVRELLGSASPTLNDIQPCRDEVSAPDRKHATVVRECDERTNTVFRLPD